jgi:dynactin 1
VINHLAELHLNDGLEAFAEEVLMRAQVLQSALENSATILATTRTNVLQLVQEDDEESDEVTVFERSSDSTLSLLRTAKVVASKLYHVLRDMKSRSLSLDPETIIQFDRCSKASRSLSDYFKLLGESISRVINDPDSEQYLTFTQALNLLRQTSSTYNQSETTDLFYNPQKSLRGLTEALNDLTTLASEFSNLTEFEKPPPPWILRSKELASRKVVSVQAEEEIKNLRRDLQDRATALKRSQTALEEAGMKIEFLEKRAEDAKKKAEKVAELEVQVKTAGEKERSLEHVLEKQMEKARKVEEERDRWMRAASDVQKVKKSDGAVRAIEMVGSSAEMEALRTDIQTLEATNRYLRQQFCRALAEHDIARDSWLSVPLRAPRRREDDTATEIRQALRNISNLPQISKPVKLSARQRGNGGKDTPRYQLVEQEIKRLKAFDAIAKGSEVFGWKGVASPKIVGIDIPEVET